MPKPPPYELFDHTADVGVRARGRTLAEAFVHAAEGVYAVMVELADVREKESRAVSVQAQDREGLLVAWLGELLFLTDTEGLLFRRFHIDELDERHLKAHAFGERADPDRHRLGTAVKAVTRHLLKVEEGREGWRIQVILDI